MLLKPQLENPQQSVLADPAEKAPRAGDRQRVYLLPGALHASAEATQVTTILGSCVAVCLWDTKLQIGGMNHFLLPAGREGQGLSMRFGDAATHELLRRLLRLGSHRRDLIAKIFGGAALFRTEDRYATSLGAKNVDCAISMMANAGITLAAQDTGGDSGRKIVFNTDDGSAWSRQV